MNLGNGGAGPDYGLYSLRDVENDLVRYNEDYLSKPFPNDEIEELIKKTWFASFEFGENVDEELRKDYYTQGSFRLSHQGCGYYDFLIVSGDAKDKVWDDGRVTDQGMGFLAESFLKWYETWLDKSIHKIKTEKVQPTEKLTDRFKDIEIDDDEYIKVKKLSENLREPLKITEKIDHPKEGWFSERKYLKFGFPYGIAVLNGKVIFLSIFNEDLSVLPDILFEMEHLEILGLANNNIDHIPEGIGKLNALYSLTLGSNNLNVMGFRTL